MYFHTMKIKDIFLGTGLVLFISFWNVFNELSFFHHNIFFCQPVISRPFWFMDYFQEICEM